MPSGGCSGLQRAYWHGRVKFIGALKWRLSSNVYISHYFIAIDPRYVIGLLMSYGWYVMCTYIYIRNHNRKLVGCEMSSQCSFLLFIPLLPRIYPLKTLRPSPHPQNGSLHNPRLVHPLIQHKRHIQQLAQEERKRIEGERVTWRGGRTGDAEAKNSSSSNVRRDCRGAGARRLRDQNLHVVRVSGTL